MLSMKKSSLLLLITIFAFSISALAKTSQKTVDNIFEYDGNTYELSTQYKDDKGTTVFYRAKNGIGSAYIRYDLQGKVISYINGMAGSFISTKLPSQRKFFPISNLERHSNVFHSKTLKIKKNKTLNLTQSSSVENMEIKDTEVTVAFVVDADALKDMWQVQHKTDLTPYQQIQASIDRANLILVNSGVTAFHYKLGDIIQLPAWADKNLMENYVTGGADATDNNIALALGRGNADRVVFPLARSLFPDGFLGFAPQWQFVEHNENKGIIYSQFRDRTAKVDAKTLETNTLAHELGHTLGLGHERHNNSEEYDYALPYGYTDKEGSLATVMSYGLDCEPCFYRPDIFSNPNIEINGQPAGKSSEYPDAADNAGFIKKTWPMTTTSQLNLQPITQKIESNRLSVSWGTETGLIAQTAYVSSGLCPALPSPMNTYNIHYQLDESYSTYELDATTHSLQLEYPIDRGCIIVVGEFNFNGTSLYKPIAMSELNAGWDIANFIAVDKPQLILSEFGQQLSFTIKVSGQSLVDDLEVQIKAPSGTEFRGIFDYTKVEESPFAAMFSSNIVKVDDHYDITLSFSENLNDYATLLTYADYGFFNTGLIPLRIYNKKTHSSSLVSLNIKSLFNQFPRIQLEQSSAKFDYEDTVQEVTAIIENLSDANEISITNISADKNWQLESSNIESLGDKRFKVTIRAPKPKDSETEHMVKIAVSNTGIQQYVPFFNVDWPYVALDSSTIEVAKGQLFTISGILFNKDITYDEYGDLNLKFTTAQNLDFSFIDESFTKIDEDRTLFSFTGYAETTGRFVLWIDLFENNVGYSIGKLNLIVNEIIDSDGDGIPDNIDTDDDNDGVLDADDAFPFDPAESVDTDGDGIGNNADTDDDNDGVLDADDAFPLDATESVDTDGDGIGNNADTDDDNDGILDEDDSEPLDNTIGDDQPPVIGQVEDITVEATGETTELTLTPPSVTDNNLYEPTITSNYSGPLPLGTHEIVWTATDFAGNTATAVQSVSIVDTTAPIIEVTAEPITINARGITTDISRDLHLTAIDIVDGEVTAKVKGDSRLTSGQHVVSVLATDKSGNTAETDVTIWINPLVQLSDTHKVSPGTAVSVPVYLSGQAPNYPVVLNYTVTDEKLSTTTAEVTIEQGVRAVINVAVNADAVTGENVTVAIDSAFNAVVNDDTKTTLKVVEDNFAPTVQLHIEQNGQPVSVVDTQGGNVTVTAVINDVNSNDQFAITWTDEDGSLSDLQLDTLPTTFEFSPESLTSNTYHLNVLVKETNTSDQFETSITEAIVVDANMTALSTTTDSDNDGLSDADEGYGDEDNDGIANYLDNDANASRLPNGNGAAPIQTLAGLTLKLGDIKRASEGVMASNALLTEDDIANNGGENNAKDSHFESLTSIVEFNITGLKEVGGTMPVVIPLPADMTIPEGAVYRKYRRDKGWYDFVIDADNAVMSAQTDIDGNCPAPLSDSYQDGLTAGDQCIQLLIKDGGENDADGVANGVIADPGVLAIEQPNQAPAVMIKTASTTYKEGETVTLTAEGTDPENDAITYQWEQQSGPAITLTDNMQAIINFTAPQVTKNETIVMKVTVSDGDLTATTTVSITINNVEPVVTPPKKESSGGGAMSWLLLLLFLSFHRYNNKRQQEM
jgi:hypothetical protein